MCEGCYKELGSPDERSTALDKVMLAKKLIEAVYSLSAVGGSLHCQLDDWNLDDAFFTADSRRSVVGFVDLACFDVLQELTIPQRATALALYDGYLK